MRLVTIPISHYCERARWALEFVGLEYREDQHVQLFHWPFALAAGGTKTVPVLVTDSGVFTDSGEVVAYADSHTQNGNRLYPDDPSQREEIIALERNLQDPFGVESRRVMYGHVLRWGRQALPYNAGRAPGWERMMLHAGFPLAKAFLGRYLEVNPQTEAQANDRVRKTFDQIGARLKDGRRYLMGDAFTAADLTFACMSAAVISPPQYGVPLPQLEDFPEESAKVFRAYREHPAGAFAMRIFAEHRFPKSVN